MTDTPATPSSVPAPPALALAPAAPVGSPSGLLHPYLQLLISAVLVAIAEILLKKGATHTAEAMGSTDWTGVTSLISPWVWGGIVCYIASFVSWLHVLRFVPLIVAFNLMNSVHVLVPLGAWLFLGEQVPIARIGGIALILAGVLVLAGPLATLESKLEEKL